MNQALLSDDFLARPLPDFLPEHIRQACAGKAISYTIPRAVRERMQVPENLTVSQWAEKYRTVTEIDAHPGPWRSDLVPHARFIMDLISRPSVREVWLCMVERAGKTNIILNSAMWQLDRGVDSGNVFWLMPTENEAKKAIGERIIEALQKSPRTARLLSRYADDTTRTMIRFKHGPRLFPSWSNSAASVSSFFGRLNIADEVDKFDTKGVGKETDIITLFRKRGRDRDDSKFVFASTPAQGYIHKGTMACQQVWTWRPRCPHCDDYILMDEEHFVIPEEATAQSLKNGEHPVQYSCNACGTLWDEADRKAAFRNGREHAIKGADVDRPETVGVHLPAWALPQIRMAEIGAAIVRAQNGDLAARLALSNGYAAEDYEPPKAAANHDDVLALCDDRPRNVVPDGSAALIAQVDTQQDGFYYEVCAVDYGDEGTSHLVAQGYLLTFDDLKTLASRTWEDSTGKGYRIGSALIDSGGRRKAGTPPKHSRTKEVYEFCLKNPVFFPVKGRERSDVPVKYTNLTRWPGTNKAIPGGLILAVLDVHYYKDELARRLAVAAGDPGSFNLHCGYTVGQLEQMAKTGIRMPNGLVEYAKHLCSEYRDELGQWQHDRTAGRNDYADCATYRMFHIELVRMRGQLAPPQETGTEGPSRREASNNRHSENQQRRRW